MTTPDLTVAERLDRVHKALMSLAQDYAAGGARNSRRHTRERLLELAGLVGTARRGLAAPDTTAVVELRAMRAHFEQRNRARRDQASISRDLDLPPKNMELAWVIGEIDVRLAHCGQSPTSEVRDG